jgi:monofunctional biosynthetic peptidoglycan transglycosylase
MPESSVQPKSLLRLRLASVGRWVLSHKLIVTVVLLLLLFGAEYLSMPSSDAIERLKKSNPSVTALMEQRKENAESNGKKYIVRQQWVPLSQMSDQIKKAVIVAEDGMFYEHEGIDWYEVKQSLKKDLQKGRFVRGASTITQQVAKNLFLSTSKDPIRKIKEIIIAKSLEDKLTKRRILEIYLNIIEWGNGIFGVEAASRAYFGKHASELTRDEAARLAAVIPNPLRYQPNQDNRFVRYRKNVILARMDARGW